MPEEQMERIPVDRTLPRTSGFEPPRARATVGLADHLETILNKKPLTVIADAIVDLRYGDIMEMARSLAELDSSGETKAVDSFKSAEGYAALLFQWANKVRKETEPKS